MEAQTQRNYEKWMHRLADDYTFLMHQAEYHVAGNRYAEARQDYAKASLLAPQKPQPYVGLGAVNLCAGDLEKARTAFETARRLDAACAKACCGLAIIHHSKGRWQEAMEMYRGCLEIDGDSITALLGLFEVSAEQGRFEQVKRFLQQYLLRHANDVAVMLCLAAVYLQEELFAAAREVLFDILVLDPQNAAALALLEELDHIQINEELDRARQMYLTPYC